MAVRVTARSRSALTTARTRFVAMAAMLAAFRLAALLLAVIALVGAPVFTALAGGPVAATDSGPRGLPTFVDLELDAFPRPAAEACADNSRLIRIAPPATIADALAAATPGTTILVAPGTYVEQPDEPTALSWTTPNVCLLGAGRADAAGGAGGVGGADGEDGEDGDGEVVLHAASGQKYGLDLRADDAVLAGFTLSGFHSAIGLWKSEGETQHAVTIERTRIVAPRGDWREGIVAVGDNRGEPGRPLTVDGLLLLDVDIEGMDMGVSCNAGPCAHWWIERTSVRGRRGSESSGADTIAVEDGRQVVVIDSVASNAAADGIDLKAYDAVVMATRVLDAGRNAIKLWHGGDVLDTVVDGSDADAALVGHGAGRYRYAHVLVTHHGAPGETGYVGTWAYDEPADVDVEIVDSVFVENATGGLYVTPAGRVRLEHDDFADAGAKLLDRGDRIWYTEDLAALEAAGLGVGNLSADPRLCADWTPARGSPLIDAGVTVPRLDRDLWGEPRLAGTAPDIGPVERGPEGSGPIPGHPCPS